MLRFVPTVLFLLAAGFVQAGNIVLEGRYQQRNIFVVNPVSDDGVGYCIYEVNVNGQVASDEINAQAFEIDLTGYNLKEGDPVVIVLKHKDGCTPRILNPGALEPGPSFECDKIECTAQGLLTWETTGEKGKLSFMVQQFKWNKWVQVGEVMGTGTPGRNSYKFQASLTSGLNRFRVVQKGYEGDIRKSPTAEVTSTAPPVTFRFDKKLKVIQFSAENAFELFNSFGQVVKRGTGTSIEVASLPKGEYFLSYDNKTEKFISK
ncbi:MAG: hypothetical protein ACK5XV_01080 [Flavobacteriales bacterium]|jgi:hypothetical protein